MSAYEFPWANILSISRSRSNGLSSSVGGIGLGPLPMLVTNRLALSPCTGVNCGRYSAESASGPPRALEAGQRRSETGLVGSILANLVKSHHYVINLGGNFTHTLSPNPLYWFAGCLRALDHPCHQPSEGLGLPSEARARAHRTMDDLGLNRLDVRYYRLHWTRQFVADWLGAAKDRTPG